MQKRIGNILALSVIIIFFILSITRSYPSGSSLSDILSQTGDDWSKYARFALDIKHNGMLIPSTATPYVSPCGFLYNYFVALCLAMFGENTIPIFIMQHIMLGLSVALVYWTFRNKMRNFTSLLFLCAMFVFAYLDIYKYYSIRLLSENLALLTISLFFFCFVKGFEKNNVILQLMAAFFMGMSILTRPNIIIVGIALIPVVSLYYFKKGKKGFRNMLLFMLVLVISSSFLGIRNYLVCKKLVFLPTLLSSFSHYMVGHTFIPSSVDPSRVDKSFLRTIFHLDKDTILILEFVIQKPLIFLSYYLEKVLFCLGFLPILAPKYHFRPHWMIMWGGYFTFLFLRIKNREKLEMWEAAVHLYIWCYYASLMSTAVANYGFRLLIPVTNFVLLFSFMALDRLVPKKVRI